MALKMKNPAEAWSEYLSARDSAETPVNIDEHPNKDWLRAT